MSGGKRSGDAAVGFVKIRSSEYGPVFAFRHTQEKS